MLVKLPKYKKISRPYKKYEAMYYIDPSGEVNIHKENLENHWVWTPDGKKHISSLKSPYHVLRKALYVAKKLKDLKAQSPLKDESNSYDRWTGHSTKKGKKPLVKYDAALITAVEDRYCVKLTNVRKVKGNEKELIKIKKLKNQIKWINDFLKTPKPRDMTQEDYDFTMKHYKKLKEKWQKELKCF